MSSSNNDPIKKMKNISIPFMRKSCHAFIKQVKDASSAEEERVLIANESSNIRSDFGQQKTTSLREDLTKLIFIYLLGYPAHFGQMACLQLISSPVFQDKRIGYLAMNLFIHESNDILLLTVNSIKNDIRTCTVCRWIVSVDTRVRWRSLFAVTPAWSNWLVMCFPSWFS